MSSAKVTLEVPPIPYVLAELCCVFETESVERGGGMEKGAERSEPVTERDGDEIVNLHGVQCVWCVSQCSLNSLLCCYCCITHPMTMKSIRPSVLAPRRSFVFLCLQYPAPLSPCSEDSSSEEPSDSMNS